MVQSVFPLVLVLTLSGAILGCTATGGRTEAGHTTIKKRVGEEVARICALPEPERQAEIRRVWSESGLELHCAEKDVSKAP